MGQMFYKITVVVALIAISLPASPANAKDPVNAEGTTKSYFGTTSESPLPALNIDKSKIAVSGISSGGFMAHAFHVIHSSRIAGAGMVASGPYECAFESAAADAQPSAWKGMYECTGFMKTNCPTYGAMCPFFSHLPISHLIIPEKYLRASDFFAGPGNKDQGPEEAREASEQMAQTSVQRALDRSDTGRIDPLDQNSNLFNGKVFIFTGSLDTMLPRGVADATVRFYQKLYEQVLGGNWKERLHDNLMYVTDLPAAHAILTDNYLTDSDEVIQACDVFKQKGTFINTCSQVEKACSQKNCDEAKNLRSACALSADLSTTCDVVTSTQCTERCDKAVRAGHSSNAGDILKHLYGALTPPSEGSQPRDSNSSNWKEWANKRMYAFSQLAYDKDNPYYSSLGNEGYLFIPEQCNPNSPRSKLPNGERVLCRLHVAFHGCAQGYTNLVGAEFSPKFPLYAGYNEWADANDIVVLYPQVQKMSPVLPLDINYVQHTNPGGCWDFWAYTDAEYATYEGRQVHAVSRMVNALVGTPDFLRTSSDTGPRINQ